MADLKTAMEPFTQAGSCFEVAPKLGKCCECKTISNRRNEKLPKIFCRFYAFRRLMYSDKGKLIAEFCCPDDAEIEDLRIWMPEICSSTFLPADLDMAKYVVTHVGDLFCDLVQQEKEATSWMPDATAAWKRAVQGVREMCDICVTTIFNVHWVCRKCGFVVCIDCFKMRMHEGRACGNAKCVKCLSQGQRWPYCSVRKRRHEADQMMLTQVIPSTALWDIGNLVHEARDKWDIRSNCPCGRSKKDIVDDNKAELSNNVADIYRDIKDCAERSNPLSLLADVALREERNTDVLKEEFDGNEDSSAPSVHKNDILTKGSTDNNMVVEHSLLSPSIPLNQHSSIKCNLLSESSLPFSGAPHSWLNNGRLLKLCEPKNPNNLLLFQIQWKQGQPVLVSNCDFHLEHDLWKPDTFCEELGHLENDLINCSENTVIVGKKMKAFWDGFESMKMRLLDRNFKPMTLKLKDWPSTNDFADILPKHFKNLMEALPLPEYTHRTGAFNLVSHLPEFFVKPDLGPKMYSAYGSSCQPEEASTNLHLDISDAVNIMMYVGIPKDDAERHSQAALKAIDEAGCDVCTKNRVSQGNEIPGALWHIYHPKDSDKIRELLGKVAEERGEEVEPHHDPIHDQSWYLDRSLNDRLRNEYGVVGYTILQCLGDAVFIPAGAPHQVRNLHSCIKCAEDFVSPENLASCLKMTQEFRQLSNSHSNHEDKLQVKNIIYHAMKDAVSVLMREKLGAQ